MSRSTGVILGFFAVGLFVLTLFSVQNSARTVQLSLNFGLVAWQLKEPIPVVGLIWGSFSVGAALGAALIFSRGAKLKRRIRDLEQQVALGSGGDWR